MKIEQGKRYVDGRGRVTGRLEFDPDKWGGMYPFVDPKTTMSYAADGTYWRSDRSKFDLITEYRSPVPAVLITAALCIAMLAGAIWFERTFPEVEYLEAGQLTDNDRSE